MDPIRMRDRGVRFTNRRYAVLKDHTLQFNKLAAGPDVKHGEGKGNIIPKDGDFVEGVVYEIPASDIQKLDKFEGYPAHYDKNTINVTIDNDVVETITYIARPNMCKTGLKPSKEYLSHYLAAKDILTEEYYKKLESWPTID